MWEAKKGGIYPQPWHHGIISTRQSPKIAKSWPSFSSVTVKGCTYMPMYLIERCQKHFIYVRYGCENKSKVVYSLGSASTGSVPNGNRSVTSSITSPHKNVNFGCIAGKEVVIFFNQTLQGSYWELFECIGLLRIGPGAIWKNGIFSCGTVESLQCSELGINSIDVIDPKD